MTTILLISGGLLLAFVIYSIVKAEREDHKDRMMMLVNRIRYYKLMYPKDKIDEEWEKILKKYGPMYDAWAKSEKK